MFLSVFPISPIFFGGGAKILTQFLFKQDSSPTPHHVIMSPSSHCACHLPNLPINKALPQSPLAQQSTTSCPAPTAWRCHWGMFGHGACHLCCLVREGACARRLGHLNIPKDGVELLSDPDEGGATAQLLKFASAYVGAGGAHSS